METEAIVDEGESTAMETSSVSPSSAAAAAAAAVEDLRVDKVQPGFSSPLKLLEQRRAANMLRV